MCGALLHYPIQAEKTQGGGWLRYPQEAEESGRCREQCLILQRADCLVEETEGR